VKGGTSVVCWTDKREIYLFTNMHEHPISGHYVDEEGNASKPLCIESYKRKMGFVDMSDMMANSYSISRKAWKWTKKLFFHLVDLTVLKAFIIHSSCGGTLSHKVFRERLVSGFTHAAQDINTSPTTSDSRRPSSQAVCVCRLDVKHSNHWPNKVLLEDVVCLLIKEESQDQICEGCNNVSAFIHISNFTIRNCITDIFQKCKFNLLWCRLMYSAFNGDII
jgi:hypothetical protein